MAGGLENSLPLPANRTGNSFHENVGPQFQIKTVENTDHRLGIVVLPEKSKLQSLFRGMYGEENSAALAAFYRINLTYREIRMFLHICLETGEITSQATGLAHFEILGDILSWAHADGSRHIHVSGSKKAAVYIGIQSPFRFHEFICMVNSNVMKRLSFY